MEGKWQNTGLRSRFQNSVPRKHQRKITFPTVYSRKNPRKVGWESERWNTMGLRSWRVLTYESQLLNFPECCESVFKCSHLLKIKLIYNKINYIKNKENNTPNSLLPILLHLTVIYAFEVICIYSISNYIMGLLYNGVLLFISSQLCVRGGDVYCLKSAVVRGLLLR